MGTIERKRRGGGGEEEDEQRKREENCEEQEARGLRRCSYLCAASFVQGERTIANVLVLIARERGRAERETEENENENIASSRFATRPIDRHRHLTFVTVGHRFPFLSVVSLSRPFVVTRRLTQSNYEQWPAVCVLNTFFYSLI